MPNLPPTDKPVVMESGDVVDLHKMITELREENERLREALEFIRQKVMGVRVAWDNREVTGHGTSAEIRVRATFAELRQCTEAGGIADAAPVDKGIPKRIYDVVCAHRDASMTEKQMWRHDYEVEVLRSRDLEKRLDADQRRIAALEAGLREAQKVVCKKLCSIYADGPHSPTCREIDALLAAQKEEQPNGN